MPQFSHRPPVDDNRHGFRLIRTPASPPLQGYVLSENMIGCPTHFVGNRTVPCERPTCQACNNGISWRWHGYLFVLTERDREQVIFEFTAAASDAFQDYHARHGTLRGCHFKAYRANAKTNGRVLIICKPADLAQLRLPEPRDLRLLLCHIWNIAPNQTTPGDRLTRPPAEDVRIDRARPEMPTDADRAAEAAARELTRRKPAGNGRPRLAEGT